LGCGPQSRSHHPRRRQRLDRARRPAASSSTPPGRCCASPTRAERWADLGTRKADPWAALAAGLELTLPTLREYVDRNQAIDQYLATPVTAIDTQRSGVAGREIRVPVA